MLSGMAASPVCRLGSSPYRPDRIGPGSGQASDRVPQEHNNPLGLLVSTLRVASAHSFRTEFLRGTTPFCGLEPCDNGSERYGIWTISIWFV